MLESNLSQNDSSFDPSRLIRRRMRLIFSLVITVGLVIGLAMTFVMRMSNNLAKVHSRHLAAVHGIQLDVTLAHLWFEEILNGDENVDIEEVWRYFEQTRGHVLAMLNGAEMPYGTVTPVEDPLFRKQLGDVLNQLINYEETALKRFEAGTSASSGSELDQAFDLFFENFLTQTHLLNDELNSQIKREIRNFRIVQLAMLVFFIALAVGLLTAAFRYEKGRVEATRLLAASEKRYRSFFEAAIEGIIIADLKDFTFKYANPAICEMLGYTSEELMRTRVMDIHPKSEWEEIADLFQKNAQNKKTAAMDLPCLRKDGSVFHAEIRSGLVEIEGRAHSIGFFTDLTERRQVQEEKEKLETQLRQAQKMQAVGNLAGGIAHDFNNLLQAILGYSELMLENENLPAECNQDLQKIQQAAERAADLTRQLLTFSRRQLISPKDINLNQVITEALQMLERLIGAGIELQRIAGHNLGTVCVDRSQLEQIFMNLCLNARDAMNGKGTLTIETENVVLDSAYCQDHPWAQPGRFVLLSITDTGMGMDKETLKQIFEPFFTTKEIGKGTGLGLATVYGIVKQNSGMVHVYSEAGHGTTFKIYFPLVERPALEVGNKINAPVRGGDETILLAEDDPGVLGLATRILQDAGYRVLSAQDGEKALEIFRANPDAMDLALLDVVMPKLGGREVQKEIQRTKPDFKVVFASGYSENAIHTDFILDKGNILVQKPYRRNDLLNKIRQMLDS
ncbi:MAG: PAS domain S-box protein [Gemmatimonadales bacterium]|nr:PAS domain S-box protein [Gemmatimonadales bacterium]